MQEREYRIAPQDEHPSGRLAAWAQWERAVPRPWWRRHPEFVVLAAFVLAVAGFIATRSHTSASGNTATQAAASTLASPAQMLADLDGDTTPTTQYQTALDSLAPQCTQDQAGIAALANAGYQDLVKNGITDETRLTVLQHLAGSVPAGTVRVDCTGVLSAYLVLREG